MCHESSELAAVVEQDAVGSWLRVRTRVLLTVRRPRGVDGKFHDESRDISSQYLDSLQVDCSRTGVACKLEILTAGSHVPGREYWSPCGMVWDMYSHTLLAVSAGVVRRG